MFDILILIAGFAFLFKGADYMIDGVSALARRFHVSDLFVGLTIIAFGTSAPELMINVVSSVKGVSDIGVGDIIGSNIANLLLVLGVAALVSPLVIKHDVVTKEVPLSLGATVLLALLVNDHWAKIAGFAGLSRTDGLILLTFFVGFIYYVYIVARSSRAEIKQERSSLTWQLASFLAIFGLAVLAIGGQLVVKGAENLAQIFHWSQAFIGLTIVALGTALPDLATSVVAAYKRKADIAIGNVIGSNILNISWALGLSAVIRPIAFNPAYDVDLLILMLANIILLLWLTISKKNKLTRGQGVVLVMLYVLYMAMVVYRR